MIHSSRTVARLRSNHLIVPPASASSSKRPQTGQFDAARDAFQEALRQDPADARAHYNLADALETMGQHQAACEHWRRYLRYDQQGSQWAMYARKQLAMV